MKHKTKRTVTRSRGRRIKRAPAKLIIRQSLKRNPKKKLVKRKIRQARPVHKRILLHPLSILVILCAGVFIAGWTIRSMADSYTVSATVVAVAPSSPATITSPADQTHFTVIPVTISGVCSPNTYVELFRNSNFSGVANCGPGVTSYHINTNLSPGANDLYTRIFSVTNNEGPVSAHITLFYDLSRHALGVPLQIFWINSAYQYQVSTYGQNYSLDLSLSGGVSPYAVNVSWGDGSLSTVVRKDQSAFALNHIYRPPGNKLNYYTILVQAVDSNGAKAFLQMTAIARGQQVAGLLLQCVGAAPSSSYSAQANTSLCGSSSSPSSLAWAKQWLWLVWPTYVVVVLMIFSFWLGERQELLVMMNKRRAKRRRHI